MIYSQHFVLMVRVLFGMLHFRRMRVLLEAKKVNPLTEYFETLYSASLRIIFELRGTHITEQKNCSLRNYHNANSTFLLQPLK